jgi:hypothetical protein
MDFGPLSAWKARIPIASWREAGMRQVRGIDGAEAGYCFIVILGGVSQCSCADIRSIPVAVRWVKWSRWAKSGE